MLPQYLGGRFADDLILSLRWRMTMHFSLWWRGRWPDLSLWIGGRWPDLSLWRGGDDLTQPLERGRWPDLSLWWRRDDLTTASVALWWGGRWPDLNLWWGRDDLTSTSGEREMTWRQPLVRGRWPNLSLWWRADDLTTASVTLWWGGRWPDLSLWWREMTWLQVLSLSGEVGDDLTSASGEGEMTWSLRWKMLREVNRKS